jgi:hypothetical protein
VSPGAAQEEATAPPSTSFADRVDLTAFGKLAVHTEGRVKSFDSFAAGMMKFVTGSRKVDDRSSAFTYLDLMLRPELYHQKDCIYVKNKLLRAEIVRALDESIDAERHERFMSRGLIAPELLRDERVQRVLTRLSTDLMRSARFVEKVQTALAVHEPRTLRANLRLLPPPGGTADDAWFTLDELAMMGDHHPAFTADRLPADLKDKILAQWRSFTDAWARGDAETVNEASVQLAASLPLVNSDPEVYPDTSRLSWESWYFRSKNMTWVWLIYAISLVPLLLFAVFRWPAARWTGLALFFIAFGFHTFAVLLRWYVSGRWPNSNMFEAITTAA